MAGNRKDERDQPVPGKVTGWRALGGIIALRGALAGYNRQARQLDPEDPGIVAVSDEAAEVAERAFELGEEGRDNDQAVAELVALAHGNRRVLETAERFSRQEARHRENRMFNLAQRLLLAAADGRPVEPLSDDARILLDAVEAFDRLSPEQHWAVLCERDARLNELETETKAGAFHLPPSRHARASNEILREMDREQLLDRTELGKRLRAIVGPRAQTDDPLLGSRAAHAAALGHLTRQLPEDAA